MTVMDKAYLPQWGQLPVEQYLIVSVLRHCCFPCVANIYKETLGSLLI